MFSRSAPDVPTCYGTRGLVVLQIELELWPELDELAAQVTPPLARMTSPVTAVLAPEHRNAMVGTTSSGGSSRRMGDSCSRCWRTAAGRAAAIRSVSVRPGINTSD